MRVFLNHSTNKEILIVMAKLKDALPPHIIEKMAIEYMINPVDAYSARPLASAGKWDVNWNVFKNVCDDNSEYSAITHRFHTQRIKKWIEFCIDNMIKKNILVQHNDPLRTLSFSDDYLSQMTSDFSLDESILNPHDEKRRLIVDAIVEELIEFQAAFPDGYDTCSLEYWVQQDIIRLRYSCTFEEVKSIIDELVDDGMLIRTIDVNNNTDVVKLSAEYFEKSMTDFSLDEAHGVESPYFSDVELRQDIIDIITSFPDSTKGAVRHYLLEKPKYYRFLKFKEFTNMMHVRIMNLINEMIDACIISCDAGHLGKAALTDEYLSKETKDFSLDEGRVQQKKYYSEELGPRLGKKFKFNEDAIRNLIIYELMHEEHTTFFRTFRDRIFEIVTERKSIWSSKVAEIFEDYVASLIKKMVSEKIIKWSDNPDGFWGPIIKLSDDFIDKEVSDFNLDEGVQRSADLFATDENGNIIFDDAELRSKVVIWLTSNEIEQDDISFTPEELANEIIWDDYLKPIAIEQGEFSEDSWNAPNVVDVMKRMSIVIDNMFNTGMLDHGPGGAMQVSSSHIDKETSDFNLDEGIEGIASKSFTIKDSFATFNRAIIKEMILDLVIDSISKDKSLESYEIRMILQPKIGQYWKEKQDKWTATSTYQYENFLSSLNNVIYNLINELVDEDVLSYEELDYETLVVLSDKYLGKITKDFSLDE
jgi:hypothetical protein